MDALNAFLQMGGYSGYVWPAYAVTAAVLGGLALSTLYTRRRRAALLASLEAAAPRRRGGRAAKPVAGEAGTR